MNPIALTERLKGALIRYLLTTFDVNRDGENGALYAHMRTAFEADTALISGPFLELSLPHRQGRSIRQMVDEEVLSPRMLNLSHPPIPFDAPLYTHQDQAVERISAGHSVIVSSGTGSGKTESFLIPILNDLLQNPGTGVRAVLVYPLNALVNDQLDRLQKLLTGTAITYGRYTSELKNKTADAEKDWDGKPPPNMVISREQIRTGARIPNLLITNYAMLEYLLMRPQDSGLFKHSSDWRYIVLDEAHTYSGAKGIEVAHLLRRLKQRLGKQRGDMVCIGTSATLTNDTQQAIDFAQTLFGEDFTEEDIIFGQSDPAALDEVDLHFPEPQAYLGENWDQLLSEVRGDTTSVESVWETLSALQLIPEGLNSHAETVERLLYDVLLRNGDLRKLRDLMEADPETPLSLNAAAQQVFPLELTEQQGFSRDVAERDRLHALYHLVELSAMARPTPDQMSLLPARYHLFARSPLGLWACLNPNCTGRPEGHQEPWSRLFTAPCETCASCGSAVHELVVCRSCGQVYVKAYYDSAEGYLSEPQDRIQADRVEKRYFVWRIAAANEALDESEDDDEGRSGDKMLAKRPQIGRKAVRLCLNPTCRSARGCKCTAAVMLYPVEHQYEGPKGKRSDAVTHLNCCARCGNTSRIQGDEIATSVTVFGTIPLAVLTMELYRRLPPSDEPNQRQKPGEGRKLLSFYDTRQGAARYAALLQDVFNQDVYRYLIPTAIRDLQTSDASEITLKRLSEETARRGWEALQVFQSAVDDEIDQIFLTQGENRYKKWKNLSSDERNDLTRFTMTRVLAEITTNRRSRQSLESLGLIVIRYFEVQPDVSDLAAKLGLTENQTQTLIEYLLDSVRAEKLIALPDGIHRDHPAFGRNTTNNALINAGEQGGNRKDEVPWVGRTLRHRRCAIMQAALQKAGRPHDLEAVKRRLLDVWEWLTADERDVFQKESAGRYRLNPSRLFFSAPLTTDEWYQCKQCQRLHYGPSPLPCPAKGCQGEFVPLDRTVNADNNYYHYVFSQPLAAMRVEEHTAQLTPQKGQEYQRRFKAGDINVLSCSTTFEMGIDLGDLQAVVMNNVPPNVSNYRQRAGRAGRRVSGTAFIVTWAQNRPHDQTYYQQPPEIIRGQVRIPRLTLKNPEIQRRHINALLLSEFLRYLANQERGSIEEVGTFFNVQTPGQAHYALLDAWLDRSQKHLIQRLDMFRELIGSPLDGKATMERFRSDLQTINDFYQSASAGYEQQIREAKESYLSSSGHAADVANQRRSTAEKLLRRLNDEPLIDFLSSRGVLPSYSFPLYTVELELPLEKQGAAQLRLERDLSRAITEFAPGAEVVADKRLWKSAGVRYQRETPQVFEYRLCQKCNYLDTTEAAGQTLLRDQCPVCNEPYSGVVSRYLTPDGFWADKDSGKPAGQYVKTTQVQPLSAIVIPRSGGAIDLNAFYSSHIQDDGRLHYINRGEDSKGYLLCQKCGFGLQGKTKECPVCKSPQIERLQLGHKVGTTTLQIHFNPPPEAGLGSLHDLSFWLTLQTALVLGATKALQIERDDINGTLFPIIGNREQWERSLVLYDAVPGGAGYMADIESHFTDVVDAALKIVNCPHCSDDTSCNRCLRDFNNQQFYPLLKRGKVIPFLENLYAHLTKQENPLGIMPVIANQPLEVLWGQVNRARTIYLAAETLTDDMLPGKTESWLDLLSERLRSGAEVHLLVQKVPSPIDDKLSLIAAEQLRLMLTRGDGLKLRQVDALPDWHLIVDPDDPTRRRAFQFKPGNAVQYTLAPALLNQWVPLNTTTMETGVAAALTAYRSAETEGRRVSDAMLQPPPKTQVFHIPASGLRTSEAQIEGLKKFFEKPVTEMWITDPYLLDYERLFHRVSGHLELANQTGSLNKVQIKTRNAQLEKGNHEEQKRAQAELMKRFPEVEISVKYAPDRREHDRFIQIQRMDGSRATLYIGRGLDFIRADGTVQATYLVLEEQS